MIKANHHIFYEKFFDLYLGWIMRTDFHVHRVIELPLTGLGDIKPLNKQIAITNNFYDCLKAHSVLMIGNHFSWWDGFFARYISQQVLGKKLHVMMLEEQLESRMFLTHLGAYSIRPNHRSVVESLQYSIDLLKDPANLITLFPQGRFQSQHQYPLRFEKGWFRVLQKSPDHAKLVFLANLTDYFAHRKPVLTSYLQIMEKSMMTEAGIVEKHYNAFLQAAIAAQENGLTQDQGLE